MKISITNKNLLDISHFFLIASILSIPFYQFRVSVFFTSFSILTGNLLIFGVILFIKNFHYIKKGVHKLFFVKLSILFIISFLPALLLSSDRHSYGVFIEWIFIPMIVGLLLWFDLSHNKTSRKYLLRSLSFITLLISSCALFHLFSEIMTYDGRLRSFYLSPNHLAMILAPLHFLSWAHLLLEKKNVFFRTIALTAIVSSIPVIIYTQSFSVLLALTLVGILLICTVQKKRGVILITVIFFGILLFGFGYQKINNIDVSFERNSLSSRFMIWETSVYLIQENALIGTGIDTFQSRYLSAQKYFPPYLEWAVPTTHNIVLHFLVTGGILSLITFAIICSYILYIGYSSYFAHEKKHYILFLCGAFSVIIFCGIFDTPYWKNDLAVIYWIIIAMILSHALPPKQVTE
jgi:O-antigen ligase